MVAERLDKSRSRDRLRLREAADVTRLPWANREEREIAQREGLLALRESLEVDRLGGFVDGRFVGNADRVALALRAQARIG